MIRRFPGPELAQRDFNFEFRLLDSRAHSDPEWLKIVIGCQHILKEKQDKNFFKAKLFSEDYNNCLPDAFSVNVW